MEAGRAHAVFCSGSLGSWDHELCCCCCFLQILLVILSSSPKFGLSSPSGLIQPPFGTYWGQISLPPPSRPLARARTLHSRCRTPTPCQGGRFLPKYEGCSGAHAWLPDCKRVNQETKHQVSVCPTTQHWPSLQRDVAVFQVGMGKPERYIFFLDTSPQNKRRVGAVFLYQSGTRKELNGWHAQKRCLIQEGLMKELLERQEGLREINNGY